MTKRVWAIFPLIFLFFSGFPVFAANAQPAPRYSYADLVDLGVNAPIVLTAQVKKTIKIKRDLAPDTPPNAQRIYVEAQVQSLIRGRRGMPEVIRYIIDLPLDARNRSPKIRKQVFLIFASESRSKPGELQLVTPDSQLPWAPELETRTRRVVQQIVASDAAPHITGIAGAFHVPGNILDEGETQIFVNTANNQPVSLSILRRPGQVRQWAVSLSEIVDESSLPPVRGSLTWYRLACELPTRIPAAALNDDQATDRVARADYQFVRKQLGPCIRYRN